MKKIITILFASILLISCKKESTKNAIVENDITWTFKKGNYNGRDLPEFSISVNPLKVYSFKLVQIQRGVVVEKILRGVNNFIVLDTDAQNYPTIQDNVYYIISIHYIDGTDKTFDRFQVY
jgi:hypothetical protein